MNWPGFYNFPAAHEASRATTTATRSPVRRMNAIINGIVAIVVVTGFVAFWVGMMLLTAAERSVSG